MPSLDCEIVPCPASHLEAALRLVVGDLPQEQQRDILAAARLPKRGAVEAAEYGLFAALSDQELVGAVWAQRQAGNTAVVWLPRLVSGTDATIADRLLAAATTGLDASGIELAQVLLCDPSPATVSQIGRQGFFHLADLLYLLVDVTVPLDEHAEETDLEFQPLDTADVQRLSRIVEQTYVETHDCPLMNGLRQMEDVLEGYRLTGVHRPDDWYIVRHRGRDVGALLLTEHAGTENWELVYMGLVPEVRGHGWGRQLTRRAIEHTRERGARRLVLAVDKKNRPALAMYDAERFVSWDERSVFIRLPGGQRR